MSYRLPLLLLLLASPALSSTCISILHDDSCLECIGQFTDKGKCVAPAKTIDKCLAYDEAKCAICLYGFRLKDEKCEKIPAEDTCIFYDKEFCAMCRGGYVLGSDGKCLKKACKTENCQNCQELEDGTEVCLLCKKDFVDYRKGGEEAGCVAAKGDLENCWETVDGKLCNECKINYFMEDKAKRKCVKSADYSHDLNWLGDEK